MSWGEREGPLHTPTFHCFTLPGCRGRPLCRQPQGRVAGVSETKAYILPLGGPPHDLSQVVTTSVWRVPTLTGQSTVSGPELGSAGM